MVFLVMLLACGGVSEPTTLDCATSMASFKSPSVGGAGLLTCSKSKVLHGRPGDVSAGAAGLAVRQSEMATRTMCEAKDSSVVVDLAEVEMAAPATLAERVAADLKANATEVAIKTIEPTGPATTGRGTLFGVDVGQVTTPVSLMGMPRTQVVRGQASGTKMCLVSVVYDPKVVTDPKALEPLFNP